MVLWNALVQLNFYFNERVFLFTNKRNLFQSIFFEKHSGFQGIYMGDPERLVKYRMTSQNQIKEVS